MIDSMLMPPLGKWLALGFGLAKCQQRAGRFRGCAGLPRHGGSHAICTRVIPVSIVFWNKVWESTTLVLPWKLSNWFVISVSLKKWDGEPNCWGSVPLPLCFTPPGGRGKTWPCVCQDSQEAEILWPIFSGFHGRKRNAEHFSRKIIRYVKIVMSFF